MKWKKKAASLLLAGCMAISMVPATAFAADVPTAVQVVESEMVMEVAEDVAITKAPITDIVALAKALAPKATDTYDEEKLAVNQETNTIQLLDNVSIGDNDTHKDHIRISGSGTNFTLDLNGKKLDLGKVTQSSKTPVGRILIADDGATLTITDTSSGKNGEITAAQAKTASAVQAQNGSKVIVNGGKITSTTGLAVCAVGAHEVNKDSVIINGGTFSGKNEIVKAQKNSTLEIHGGTITQTASESGNYGAVAVSGGATATIDGSSTVINTTGGSTGGGVAVFGKSTLNVNGGKISSKDFGIATNGSQGEPDYSGSIINVTGGEITGEAAGMYLPSSGGKTTISGSPTIQGKWGIVVRGGNITIKDNPVVTATETGTGSIGDSGSSTLPVDALVLDKDSNYGSSGAVTAKVEGGKFKGPKAVVYAEEGIQKTGTDANVIAGFISGGYFSAKPDTAYVSADKVVVDNTGTDKDTYPYTIGQAVLESANVDESTGLGEGESLVSTVVTSDDKKSGTITLVGSINEFDDEEKTIKLKLDCTNNKDCTEHKDSGGSDAIKDIKLSHLEGNLVAEPQFITVHGIKYAIKLDITEKPTNVEVVTEVAKEDPKTSETIKESDKETVTAAAENVEANDIVEDPAIETQISDIVKALGDGDNVTSILNSVSTDTATYDKIDVVTYLDVTAEEYDATSKETAHFKVDITPMVKVVAVKKDSGETPEKLISASAAGLKKNPVELNTEELENLKVKVGVPDALYSLMEDDSGNKKAYVIHKNAYIYDGKASGTSGSYTVEFTTEHGFSPMDIYPTDPAVAAIGTHKYPSLQAAIDAANNGDVITLKKTDDSKIIVKEAKQFTLKTDDGVTFTGSIKAAAGLTVSPETGNGGTIYKVTGNGTGPSTNPETNPGGSTSGGTTGGTTSNHNVTVKTAENGSVTASAASNVAPNTEVTLTVKPADGYVLDALKATISSGEVALTKVNDTTYTFKMPTADVTVTATFKLASEQKPEEDTVCKPYTDVDPSYAYHDQVHYMIENKLMTGVSNNTFGLNVVLNRAMVAQILYSKAEPTKPSYTVTNSFSDVKAGDWFANSVTWAEKNGAASGYGDGTFRPYNQVTREELVTMLYGEAGKIDVSGNLNAYTDASSVSDWAVKAMTWAIENGVVTGTTAATLSPKNTTPRYQAAIMFYKYFTK